MHIATTCLLSFCAAACWGKDFEVMVAAPERDYPAVIVSTPAPGGFPEQGWLRDDRERIPFQKTAAGEAVFVLRNLHRGKSKAFRVEAGALPASAKAENTNERVTVSIGEKRAFVYQGAESELPRPEIKPLYKRGGYIHPVFSPSGKLITDDFPPNHIHHHGIWFPWTKTVFEGREPDFWNMGEGKGKVEFVSLNTVWSGPVEAGFKAQHRFVDLTTGQPKAALEETWDVHAYSVPGQDYFVFDLVSTQSCATSSPLQLPKYYYGGLGFRGNWGWNGPENCFFLTSNGETDRVKGNETRGNWCHIGGQVGGGNTGIAILCHPDNFRAPQPMRLHPKEPFFCFAPSQLGDWAIEPGKPYISKYRFIVKDGQPDKAELDQLWESYAHPPVVTVR